MTSIGPINTSVLQLFQQFNRPDAAKQPTDAGNNILKAANGISAEGSAGTKSAAAAIGKFAVDAAPSDKPLSGKLVIGDLGSFDTWDEAKAFVNGNNTFSDSQKKAWLEKLDGYAKGFEDFQKIQASDLYQSSMSGAIRDEWLAMQEAADKSGNVSVETVMSINNLLEREGRTSMVDQMGEQGYEAFLNRIAARSR